MIYIKVLFKKILIFIYLHQVLVAAQLQYVGSLLAPVGSTSLTRDLSQAPCIKSMKS